MPRAKRTKKFASMKRMISLSDPRIKVRRGQIHLLENNVFCSLYNISKFLLFIVNFFAWVSYFEDPMFDSLSYIWPNLRWSAFLGPTMIEN